MNDNNEKIEERIAYYVKWLECCLYTHKFSPIQ